MKKDQFGYSKQVIKIKTVVRIQKQNLHTMISVNETQRLFVFAISFEPIQELRLS